jgi:hypothetical protein
MKGVVLVCCSERPRPNETTDTLKTQTYRATFPHSGDTRGPRKNTTTARRLFISSSSSIVLLHGHNLADWRGQRPMPHTAARNSNCSCFRNRQRRQQQQRAKNRQHGTKVGVSSGRFFVDMFWRPQNPCHFSALNVAIVMMVQVLAAGECIFIILA